MIVCTFDDDDDQKNIHHNIQDCEEWADFNESSEEEKQQMTEYGLIDEVAGCSFAPRCPDRDTSCNPTLDMELIESSSGHFVDICCSEGK